MSNQLVNTDISLLTTEILMLKNQTAQNIIEIGRRLLAAKEQLPHGEWGKWLEEKVEFSDRTAQRFMKAASEFSNTTALSYLPPTKIFALLDLPQEDREQFAQDHEVESMTTRELQQALKEKKELEKKLKAAEKAAKTVEKLEKDLEETRRQLTEAQAAGNTEEIERLQESLEKTDGELTAAQVRIKELEQQLKDKPIEATAAPVIERIPEDIQKELDELRKGQGNEVVIKFKVYFNEIVDNFKELLGILAELQGTDQETYGRYKNAVAGLLEKMGERL